MGLRLQHLLLAAVAVWVIGALFVGMYVVHSRLPPRRTCDELVGQFRTGVEQQLWDSQRCDDVMAVQPDEIRNASAAREMAERFHRAELLPSHANQTVVALVMHVSGRELYAPGAARSRQLLSESTLSSSDVVAALPLSRLLLSLVATAQPGFVLVVYVVYDVGDAVFDWRPSTHTPGVMRDGSMDDWFTQHVVVPLASRGIVAAMVPVRFVNRLDEPGGAVNVGMQAALDDGVDYLMHVRDVAVFETPWAAPLVESLETASPPRLGVVGPRVASQTLPAVMTHRTHMDVFGTFYPTRISGAYVSRRRLLGAGAAFLLLSPLRRCVDTAASTFGFCCYVCLCSAAVVAARAAAGVTCRYP
jgi:hypothetical protein